MIDEKLDKQEAVYCYSCLVIQIVPYLQFGVIFD